MENLNAEQIKKALECCVLGDCAPCPYHQVYVACRDRMAEDALALITSQEQRIKELEQCWEHEHASAMEIFGQWSEKCEQLSVELDAMRGAANSYKMHNKQLTEENERLKLDVEVCGAELSRYTENIVQMAKQDRADTVRKMQERLKLQRFSDANQHDYDILHAVIDRIAKEILEQEETDNE